VTDKGGDRSSSQVRWNMAAGFGAISGLSARRTWKRARSQRESRRRKRNSGMLPPEPPIFTSDGLELFTDESIHVPALPYERCGGETQWRPGWIPFYGGHTVQTIRSQGERGIGASEEH
jgi:hypothetical protein